MTAHLHIGLNASELVKANRIVRQAVRVFVDGDGWDVWGEKSGANGNDDQTFHVVLEVHSARQARAVLKALRRSVHLVPMRQCGTVASLTSPRVWSHEYWAVTA